MQPTASTTAPESQLPSTAITNNPISWPPDYRTEYYRRQLLLDEIQNDDELWKRMKENYAVNPVAWIEDWCTTYDPRNNPRDPENPRPRNMPFILFDRQKELVRFVIDCIEGRESGLIEKSRDMGATWVCCALSLWIWIYWPGAAVRWGSRKQELVDRLGDPDSIFEKLRILLLRIPDIMLPKGFNMNVHCTFMKIINPETGATIAGESGKNIGRGGRSMVYFKDESAHYEHAESIEAALSENTDVQIDMSSVNGSANIFYRRRMAGVIWQPDKEMPANKTRVFILDWRDHPDKDQDWYDTRKEKFTNEGLGHVFAQEVDRDYTASIDRLLIPMAHVKAAIDAHIKLKIDGTGEKVAGLDVADEGGDKNALAGRTGIILRHLESWAEGDTGETGVKAVNICEENGYMDLFYDCIGVGAGVKATTNRIKRDRKESKKPMNIEVHPWNASDSPKNPEGHIIPGDKKSPKNKDYFENWKAQSWWRLAQRFRKTYEVVVKKYDHPHDELISIDSTIENRHQLEIELTQIRQVESGKGKMKIDKKPDGQPSPNMADAVNICYNPDRVHKKAGVW